MARVADGTPGNEVLPTGHHTIYDLVDFQAGAQWRIVNDGVMGGRSESAFRVEGDRGVFSGNLSPDNGGGFASVRTEIPSHATPEPVAVVVRVLGDGKRYQFRIRTDEQWDGPAYKHEFATTPGEWAEVNMPLSDFELTFRGRPVPDAPPIDAHRVRQVGFLIADKQWGRFRLEIASIRAVTREPPPTP